MDWTFVFSEPFFGGCGLGVEARAGGFSGALLIESCQRAKGCKDGFFMGLWIPGPHDLPFPRRLVVFCWFQGVNSLLPSGICFPSCVVLQERAGFRSVEPKVLLHHQKFGLFHVKLGFKNSKVEDWRTHLLCGESSFFSFPPHLSGP